MRKNKWKRLKNKQFAWFYILASILGASLLALLLFYIVFREKVLILGMVAMGTIGVLFIATAYIKMGRLMKISRNMEKFIRRNNLFQSHFITEQGLLGERKIERMDYYPIIEYREKASGNIFCIRIRMDG